jgi:uncharacterized protein YyaL (SSP411 family)
MVRYGDARYTSYMNNTFAWMNNMWNHGSSVGGYFAAANVDGSGQGGGQYVDDNSLTGIVYLDCYDVTSGTTQANYLTAAENIANWLMYSGQWDTTYGGGFWWSDSKQVKPTQSNGLAMQLFLRLYQITGRTYYRDWANSVKNWLESQMYDSSDGLYLWQIESGGVKEYTKFTYDNGIMIEADLLYDRVMGDTSYLKKAEALARNMNALLWNSTSKVYEINTADIRVNPTWSGWASQSFIKLYQADGNTTWLDYAQANIDFINAHLRNNTTYGYYQYCNIDGTNVDTTHIEGVDQAWMQRIQSMMANYR